MLNPSAAPAYNTPTVNHQTTQLLGTPSLQSFSSPYFKSSYAPSSSFFIPSSIPAQQQQPQGSPGIQSMIQALRGGK